MAAKKSSSTRSTSKTDLVQNAGVPATLPSGEPDPGLLIAEDGASSKVLGRFIKAIARHRHHEREMDPPEV